MKIIYTLIRQAIATSVLLSTCLTTAYAVDNTSCDPTKLATKYPRLVGKTIKIGQDGESPPFSMHDPKDFNRLIGLDTDIARAAFTCVGVPVEFVTGKWSGLIPATMAGQIDIMWDQLLYTPERAKKLDFIAYMNSATGLLVTKGNPTHIKTLDNLCGLKATAVLGTTQEAMLRETNTKCTSTGKQAIDIITSPDIPSGLRLVQSKRADVLVGNKFVVDTMVAANPGTVDIAFDINTGAKLAVGVAKGNSDLVNAIHDSLTILQANGTLKSIYARYNINYGLVIKPEVLTK
ncbi:MAG: ABC transporter substrate-binding protein [Pseudomonadota bacterium]